MNVERIEGYAWIALAVAAWAAVHVLAAIVAGAQALRDVEAA